MKCDAVMRWRDACASCVATSRSQAWKLIHVALWKHLTLKVQALTSIAKLNICNVEAVRKT